MNKWLVLLLILVTGVAISVLSLFVPHTDKNQYCFTIDVNNGVESALGRQNATDSPPTYAVKRGFPLTYYQEPFPSNCVAPSNTTTKSAINMGDLVADIAVWSAVTLAVCAIFSRIGRKR